MSSLKRIIVFIVFISNFISLVPAIEIPSVLKICNRDDPQLNKCLKKSLKHFLPLSPNGIPELELDSLDPYFDKSAYFEFKQNQIVLKIGAYNVTLDGFSKSKVHDVRADLQDDSMYLEIDLSAKHLFTKGVFLVQGRLNAFNVNTEGYFNNSMDDLTWTWKIKGSTVEKNGKKYMKITKFAMRPEVGNMKIYMSDILPGNPELSNLFLNTANANWKILYQELLPFAERNWDRTGRRVCNKIFGKIPYDQLFPTESDE